MDTTRAAARWREAFILELRLLDVPGARIGDAMAEVEAHYGPAYAEKLY